MREINKLCFKLIAILVAFTPIGVFSLVAAAVAQSNLGSLMKEIGLFLATVLSGLAFHALIVYPCLFFLFTRSNPFRVMKNVMPAFLTAMSTASSAATFPVTYRNAVDNNKVRPSTAKFVLSLGMTMNMDGTAIGFPCAVIFMANANGMALSFGQIVGMAFTSAMASMGAGPIPSAGLVMLVSILSSVGIDATTNPIFGLIIAVDWVYDRPETALNIFGDSLGAVVVDRYTAKSNEDGLAGTEMTNTA
jgi:Na+/H+-dicarboxylate symporter